MRGGALAEAARAALAAKVLTTIGAPEIADLFGPDFRGEVSLTGLLPRPGRPDLPFSGRLDRLVLTKEGISIVDFKLGARPDRAAAAHVAQLALYRAALEPHYPKLPIRAALVYLDGPTLAPIGESELQIGARRGGRGGVSAPSTPRKPLFSWQIPQLRGCLDEVAFAGQAH